MPSRRTRLSTHSTYLERINLAIDLVSENLSGPLSLARMARAAMLSPFHFHRVFQAIVGHTPADYVKHRRLDAALAMMPHRARRPRRTLTSIALAAGFGSSSDFSRSFRDRFGAPPRDFDLAAWREQHREKLESLVACSLAPPESAHIARLPKPANPDRFKVTIRDLPARTVAYIRVARPYEDDRAARAVHRLLAWADRHDLARGQWLGYQHENPELVALKDCFYYAAVEATAFTPTGEVGRRRFPPMLVAQVEIRGTLDLELRALQWLYGAWLPRSGYLPDHHPCFESWRGRPFAHGMTHFHLDAQLPITPTRPG